MRATQANNTVNTVLSQNLINAHQSGWEQQNVQLYVIPCPAQTAVSQINNLFTTLKNTDKGDVTSYFSRVWINVETNPVKACTWSTNQAQNCQFLKDMITEITG